MVKENIKVVIIDTGVSSELYDKVSGGISLIDNGEIVVIDSDYVDNIGHGTAIVGLFSDSEVNLNLYMIKIFEDLSTSYNSLCTALEYINDNIDCELIHISLGITLNDNYDRLKKIIKDLTEKKITIVSAFDNDGAISYPAAIPEVVGVTALDFYDNDKGYYIIEGNIIDVATNDTYYRVKWVKPKVNIVRGSSFSSVKVSLDICKILETAGRISKTELLSHLVKFSKGLCKKTNDEFSNESEKRFIKEIKKAVVFPFNKEMHSLALFRDMLSFEIVGFFDISRSMNAGRLIKDILNIDIDSLETVQKISSLNWEEDFDTIIIGHCDKLNEILHYDILENLIQLANQHNKKIYALDYIDTDDYTILNKFIYSKKITSKDIIQNRFNKLRCSTKPVVGIFGTSSRQGKFTLQLSLRKALMNMGYKVGQLGTEPTSLLFGFDEVYHFGYGALNEIKSNEVVNIINEMIWRIEEKNTDITLVGCQSGTIPYDFSNLSRYTFHQFDFLLATNPDAYILVCNCYDDIDYVKRTVKFLESISGKVICLYLYPFEVKSTANGMGRSLKRLNEDAIEIHKTTFEKEVGLKVFSFDDISLLCDSIIDYLSEDE